MLKISDLYQLKILEFMHHVNHNEETLPKSSKTILWPMSSHIDMKHSKNWITKQSNAVEDGETTLCKILEYDCGINFH